MVEFIWKLFCLDNLKIGVWIRKSFLADKDSTNNSDSAKDTVIVIYKCLIWLEPQCDQIFGQILFWMFLWGCFWLKLTLKLIDWVKQIALLLWLGLI